MINQISNKLAINFCQIILDRNDAGEHFPLLAICLGFELVTKAINKVTKIDEIVKKIVYEIKKSMTETYVQLVYHNFTFKFV